MIILLFIFTAVIWGTIDYFRLPKPPKGLSNKELKYYYNGGWKEYEKQKQLDIELYEAQQKEMEESRIKLYKEIDFYIAQVNNLEDLQRLIENDLHNGSGNNKVNLSRLISLDKQIHTAQKKIEKLNNDLESLE